MKSLDLYLLRFNVVITRLTFVLIMLKRRVSGSHHMRIKIMVKLFGSWKATRMNEYVVLS